MDYVFDPDNWRWLTTGNNVPFLLEGFSINVQIAAISMVLALAVALVLALARVSTIRVISVPARLWTDLWRNLPTAFIILYVALVLPEAWRAAYESATPTWLPDAMRSGGVFVGIVGLVLYYSALIAEIFRAGIQSLARGQREAAAALGLRSWQSMRLVVLPQGLRAMTPAIVSQLISLVKNTSLVSIIAVQEAIRTGQIVSTSNFFGGTQAPLLQVFIFVGVLFVVINLALSRLGVRLERRAAARSAGRTQVPRVTAQGT